MCPGKYVATFRTARDVIRADAACRKNDIPVRVIAVPESISSECGMCLEIEAGWKEHVIELMNLHTIWIQLYDTSSV